MTESDLTRAIQLEATKKGSRLLRNNIGAFKDAKGQWVKFGLGGDGGSDLIGWRPLYITQDMVGKTIAQFMAVEVKLPEHKTKKDRYDKQISFIVAVNHAGGKAFMCHSTEELGKELI